MRGKGRQVSGGKFDRNSGVESSNLHGSEVPEGSNVNVGSSVGSAEGKALTLGSSLTVGSSVTVAVGNALTLGAGVGTVSTTGLFVGGTDGLFVGKVVWGAKDMDIDMDRLMEPSELSALQNVMSSDRTSCNSAETRRRRRCAQATSEQRLATTNPC